MALDQPPGHHAVDAGWVRDRRADQLRLHRAPSQQRFLQDRMITSISIEIPTPLEVKSLFVRFSLDLDSSIR